MSIVTTIIAVDTTSRATANGIQSISQETRFHRIYYAAREVTLNQALQTSCADWFRVDLAALAGVIGATYDSGEFWRAEGRPLTKWYGILCHSDVVRSSVAKAD
ncbi:hypothetical protein ACYX8G_18500 [Microbacterium saperdae]